MKCILMNKNIEALITEYDAITKGFNKIYEIKKINFVPIGVVIIRTILDKTL